MPDTCRLKFEIEGISSSPSTVVNAIVVHGTVAYPYSQVSITVRSFSGGLSIFQGIATVVFLPTAASDPADPANDGAWQVTFDAELFALPCGLSLFIEAEAIGASTECLDSGSRTIRCKRMPGDGGSGDPDDDDSDGPEDPENGNGEWPWPDPPHIACPRWGRNFARVLLTGLLILMSGIVSETVAVIATGVATLGAASALYMFWQTWCVPGTCFYWACLYGPSSGR